MSALAASHERITLDWINHCLADHRGSSTVTDHSVEDVGTGSGFAGTVLRVELTYDSPCDGPTSVIVKLPVKAGEIMDMLKAQDMLLRESHFYRDMAPRLSIKTPHVYHVEINGEDFAIIMQDLGDIKPDEGITTVEIEDAKKALAAIAELHAAYWNSPETDDPLLTPIGPRSPEIRKQLDDGLSKAIEMLEASDSNLDYAIKCARILRKVIPKFPEEFPLMKPITLVHGDYHPGNLHIDGDSVTIYDWQSIMKGEPAGDIANFLITSLEASDLDAMRDELLMAYYEALVSHGIDDFSIKKLNSAFDQASTQVVIKLLIVLGRVDTDVEGGDELFEIFMTRIDAHAQRVGAKWKLRLMPLIFLVIRIVNFFSKKS
jgi:aminoglycoside phosphotransferase (APT) family kinase protein